MKRVMMALLIGLFTFASAGLSCAQDQVTRKDESGRPVDHQELGEEYLKGIEESKKAVIARVNGKDITLYDLIGMMNQIVPKYMTNQGEISQEIDEKVRSEALDALIFRELAIQEAMNRGMRANPETANHIVTMLKRNAGSTAEFEKRLNMTGDTEVSLRHRIERDQLFNMIADQELFQKVKIDEGDLKNAYTAKADQFLKPEVLHVEDVVVARGDDEARAMKNAEELLFLLKTNRNDVSALAKDKPFTRNHLAATEKETPSIYKIAAGMQEGDISGVIKMDDGFHIIKLVKRQPSERMTFQEARSQVEQILRQSRAEQRKKEWEAELKKDARIEMLHNVNVEGQTEKNEETVKENK
jgi:hypothetical protein